MGDAGALPVGFLLGYLCAASRQPQHQLQINRVCLSAPGDAGAPPGYLNCNRDAAGYRTSDFKARSRSHPSSAAFIGPPRSQRGDRMLGDCAVGGIVCGRSEPGAARLPGRVSAIRAVAVGADRTVHDGSHLRYPAAGSRIWKCASGCTADFARGLQAARGRGVARRAADRGRLFRGFSDSAGFCHTAATVRLAGTEPAMGACGDLSSVCAHRRLSRNLALYRVGRRRPVREWSFGGGRLHSAPFHCLCIFFSPGPLR